MRSGILEAKGGSMRLDRESRTIAAMIDIYCADTHRRTDSLCGDCRALRDYALDRVGKCRFGADKPVCAKCPIHCYKPEMRERVRVVMRHSGPKMLLRHPALAILHMVDSARTRTAR